MTMHTTRIRTCQETGDLVTSDNKFKVRTGKKCQYRRSNKKCKSCDYYVPNAHRSRKK